MTVAEVPVQQTIKLSIECLKTRAEISKFVTPREIEVWRLIAMGKHTKEIAEHFNLAWKTVDNHRQNLYSKLGLYNANIADLTRLAVKFGIIEVYVLP